MLKIFSLFLTSLVNLCYAHSVVESSKTASTYKSQSLRTQTKGLESYP
jgi:hypothetical protein